MISKSNKIFLVLIALILSILLVIYYNFVLTNNRFKSDNDNKKNTLVGNNNINSIKDALKSETLDYSKFMKCKNKNTSKGCEVTNNNNKLEVYNTNVINEKKDELIKVDVKLNDKEVKIFKTPVNASDIKFMELTDDGLYIVRKGAQVGLDKLLIYDLSGNQISLDLGDYFLMDTYLQDGFVRIDVIHKNIYSTKEYKCSEKDTMLIKNGGNISVKITYQLSIKDGTVRLKQVKNQLYNDYCKENKGE